ncbi:MAG: ketoacyl-ACP synthase III [Bdellovibrionaceae bacterium]|nr:ketoacyl-ACP synthase III [Pseudobdellovibrionaceae bacterium]
MAEGLRRATIVGTGLSTGARLIENSYFDEKYQKDISTFLREKRNIHQRYFMDETQSTSDLVVSAAEKALKRAGLTAQDINLIIVATDTPDYLSPSTAAVVQHKLGAKNAGVFDLNTACAGFVTALDVAQKYIATEVSYKNILVVGAYGMSRYLNWDDYKIASMFADGAGAVIVSAAEDTQGIMATELYADGQYYDYMGVYAGGTAMPISHDAIEKKEHLLNFAKKIPTETNAIQWPRLSRNLLDRIQKTSQDIDHFFLTQLNIDTINAALDELGVARSKSHNVMDKFGYTGSACIPMALADAVEQKKLKKGDLVFMLGSGGGMSMAALAMEWGFDS